MISYRRAEEILQYLNDFGETKTCKTFGISIETLHRYIRHAKFNDTKNPQIILFDLETSPLECFTWGTWKQRIPHTSIIQPSFLLSWTAKQLFSSQVMSDVLTPEEAIERNDNRIVNSLWKVMENASILVAHNAKKFDLRYANTRFLMNGLKPPSPYQTIDTLEIAKKYFLFPSNKLDYLGILIHNKGKLKTDFDLWIRCLKGDAEALHYMVTYNKEDVQLLEDVYLSLRPWMRSHPNISIYQEAKEKACPTCGSTDIKECGHYTTTVNQYLAFRCNSCGAICRNRTSDIPIEQKKNILRSTAR